MAIADAAAVRKCGELFKGRVTNAKRNFGVHQKKCKAGEAELPLVAAD